MATERELQLVRDAMKEGITEPRELANFMAQVTHESHGLTRLEEGFRYTRGVGQIPVESAWREGRDALERARQEALQGNPQKLAELMYGGRMGNDEPGDGYRYRGRGYIQLTGKDNYRQIGEKLGLDLVNHPELAADPDIAMRASIAYWKCHVRDDAREDVVQAGKVINGGDNGMADRVARFGRWQKELTPELLANLSLPDSFPRLSKADLRRVQANLNDLGFRDASGASLTVDGNLGQKTREAIDAYDRTHELSKRGLDPVGLLRAVRNPLQELEDLKAQFKPANASTQWLEKNPDGMPNYLRADSWAPTKQGRQERAAAAVSSKEEGVPHAAVPERLQWKGAGPDNGVVRTLQQQLNVLGFNDASGRPLVEDGQLGPRSREAVASFQSAKGLPITGIPDERTREVVEAYALVGRIEQRKAERMTQLAASAQPGAGEPGSPSGAGQPASASPVPRLSFLDAGHPDHPLFRGLRDRLPAEVTDVQVAALTFDAKRNGIRPQRIEEAGVYEGKAYAFGRDVWSGTATVKLDASTPTLEETMRRSDEFDRQQSEKVALQAQKVAEPGRGMH